MYYYILGGIKLKTEDNIKKSKDFGFYYWRVILLILFLETPFLIILGIPILINESYMTNDGYVTLWGAKEVLSFYGAILSFLGTIFLGVIAIYQNQRALKINKRLMDLESHKNKPLMILNSWHSTYGKYNRQPTIKEVYCNIDEDLKLNDECLFFILSFINSGNHFASFEFIDQLNVIKEGVLKKQWQCSYTEHQNCTIYLKAEEEGRLVLCGKKEFFSDLTGSRIKFNLKLENHMGERYDETFTLNIMAFDISRPEPFISLKPYNYCITKVT